MESLIRTDYHAQTDLVRRRLRDILDSTRQMLDSDCVPKAVEIAELIVVALRAGGKVLFFGNGGSAMDAGHLAAELMGRLSVDRPSLPAVSLPDATAALTAIGNDYEYAEVFARQVRGLGARGDVAVGLTTSGNSPNVVRALRTARDMGITSVALTGSKGGLVADVTDICVRVPAHDTARVQEACMYLGHTICELVERSMFPDAV